MIQAGPLLTRFEHMHPRPPRSYYRRLVFQADCKRQNFRAVTKAAAREHSYNNGLGICPLMSSGAVGEEE